jgi:glucosamine-6-phosphate deaminase
MQLSRYDSIAAWRNAIVALWCERLAGNPRLRMCLPAGRTPQPIYDGMANEVATHRVSFADAEIFLLDEYGGLVPDHPARCARMLERDLVTRIDLPPQRFVALDPDATDLGAMCSAIERRIADRPFDLTLLGIGPNGHVGMNEPGSAIDSPTRRVDLAPATRQSAASYFGGAVVPTWGVTIGIGALRQSAEVWLLASGPPKADMVRRIVRGPVSAAVPATLLREHPHCRLFVDATAAAAL